MSASTKIFWFTALIVVGATLRAWVLSTLWGWFVVAHFGVRGITMPVAYGLSVLAAMFTYQAAGADDRERSDREQLARYLTTSIFAPLVALLAGAIATLWMP